MGIAPYKYFTYDGESSRNYDVYLTGEGVFNAPERAVEMLEIPGRNGNYALDQGKFNNITVTYKAGIVDVSESNFANKVSAVRNWLCSKVGYKRLSDDYNPNEYRMAVYKSGVNIDHVDLKTGEFEITFDCKPQRWLTSGETAVSVADGGTLDNPTPFEASPLLQVWGYGDINIGNNKIRINSTDIGNVIISGKKVSPSITLDLSMLNTGDSFYVRTDRHRKYVCNDTTTTSILSSAIISQTNCQTARTTHSNEFLLTIMPTDKHVDNYPVAEFKKGTAKTLTSTVVFSLTVDNNGTETTTSVTAQMDLAYDGVNTVTLSSNWSPTTITGLSVTYNQTIYPEVTGYSTMSALGSPIYIDLDIGEAYKIESDAVVSVNNAVEIPPKLPTLEIGSTEVTYDNTVTELKVQTNWWKV